MLSAMTQMQQSLLSGMMMPKQDEADGKSDKLKAEEAAHKPEQQAPKPQKLESKLEQQPCGSKQRSSSSENDCNTTTPPVKTDEVSTILV